MSETKTNEDNGNLTDLEILEKLKAKYYDALVSGIENPRVTDLLRIIEMKNKLTVAGSAEKKFWDLIDRLRREELNPRKKAPGQKKSKAKTNTKTKK